MLGRPKFVLASGSPRRLSLLNQAGIEPDALRPADVDETPEAGRTAARLRQPAGPRQGRRRAANRCSSTTNCAAPSFSPPTPWSRSAAASCPRPNLVDEASQCLRLLSGRNHRVYTAVCLVTPKEAFRQRLIETRVRFKRLSEDDIQAYIGSGEWRGKAGGYAVQGIAGSFVVKMVGSYSNVVGLPLYETVDAARRRRLSDPLRLVECQLSRESSAGSGKPASRARSAASRPSRPRGRSVPSAAATSISTAGCRIPTPFPPPRTTTKTPIERHSRGFRRRADCRHFCGAPRVAAGEARWTGPSGLTINRRSAAQRRAVPR